MAVAKSILVVLLSKSRDTKIEECPHSRKSPCNQYWQAEKFRISKVVRFQRKSCTVQSLNVRGPSVALTSIRTGTIRSSYSNAANRSGTLYSSIESSGSCSCPSLCTRRHCPSQESTKANSFSGASAFCKCLSRFKTAWASGWHAPAESSQSLLAAMTQFRVRRSSRRIILTS